MTETDSVATTNVMAAVVIALAVTGSQWMGPGLSRLGTEGAIDRRISPSIWRIDVPQAPQEIRQYQLCKLVECPSARLTVRRK